MNNNFSPVPAAAFDSFFSEFQGDTSDTLCMNCDGLCETSHGFSTTIYLLPGELEYLKSRGPNPEFLLDHIITPVGVIASWSPARTCAYLENDRCALHPRYGVKPVECAIYPVIFSEDDRGIFDVCPICRFRTRFFEHGFIDRAVAAMEKHIIPHLDPTWLAIRNELNFAVDENLYLNLRRENPQGIPIQALKECAVKPERTENQ